MPTVNRKHLVNVVRKELEQGNEVTIYGWLSSNHNVRTHQYEETGRIHFVPRRSRVVQVSQGLVLCTRFIQHADQAKLKSLGYSLYPHPIDIGVLKKVLSECRELIVRKATQQEAVHNQNIQEEEVDLQPSLQDLEDSIMTTEIQMDPYDRFAASFKDKAVRHPDSLVSARAIRTILDETGVECSMHLLIANGWIAPVTLEGKVKASWYKAGTKLEKRLDVEKKEEPSDPIDKALFLIEQIPFIERKLAELKEKEEYWKKQLERSHAAEELIRRIEEI